MARGRTITAEEKRRLVEMKLEGMSAEEISGRLDVAPTTVGHWKKYAAKLGIDVPEGKVARRKEFRIQVTPQSVWKMRARAVRARAEGYNSVQAAVDSGLRVQDIRINWRAWAEHLGIEIPPAITPEELLGELEEDPVEEDPVEDAGESGDEDQNQEEETMSKEKSPAEEAVGLMIRIEEMLTEYMESGGTVTRFVIDVDEDNLCEMSIVDDDECGKRLMHLNMRLSVPLEGEDPECVRQ